MHDTTRVFCTRQDGQHESWCGGRSTQRSERRYPEDYCLADIAAYGACILTPGHSGNHKDANGYSFTGVDRKVRS